MRGEHRSFPKPTPRLVDRMDRDRTIDRAWQALCRTVDARDGYRCRACGRRLVKTLTLCPQRLERHHLESRAQHPRLKLEPRNVICVCAWPCHPRLTRHELQVTAATTYTLDGAVYPNADGPLTFLPSDPWPTLSIESAPSIPIKDVPMPE